MRRSLRQVYWDYKEIGAEAFVQLLPKTHAGDTLWALAQYRRHFGRFPNLLRPRRFSERLLKLKLSEDGRSARRAFVTDKVLCKEHVAATVGEAFVTRTLALLSSEDDAVAFDYPRDCVIKPTHLSAEVIVRRYGAQPVDRRKIRRWFRRNYYDASREPNYRPLEPRVIVEERLWQPGRGTPDDYKVFCFGGEPKLVQVDVDRLVRHRRSFYSPEWRLQPFTMIYPPIGEPVPRPGRLDEMLAIARRLAAGFSFLRVDFYVVGSALIVGELTNFPENCHTIFEPRDADVAVGNMMGPSR